MYHAHAARYRDTGVLTASPGQLVLIVFDHLLVNLRKANLAIERNDIEQRCLALDRARQAIGELLATLDRDRGGPLAENLAGIYAFLWSQLSGIRGAGDVPRLTMAIRISSELREAFATIAAQTPPSVTRQ